MDVLKQVRKALDDIRSTLADGAEPFPVDKAVYQLDLLRKMLDEQPSRQQPWSHYQPRVLEEFDIEGGGE